MKTAFPMLNFGLYRDDGLACHRRIPGPSLEKLKKEIIKLFHDKGLKITINTGMKSVDFLDITLDLNKENFKPFKKPNNEVLYVHKNSSHPQSVLKQIPKSVNHRLQTISSGKEEFEEAKGDYQKALKDSGYKDELVFNEVPIEPICKGRTKKNRKRNIVWYNPPFNSSLTTNFGKQFLKLINKHFPHDHKLRPVINKNNVKLSYSTTRNIKRVIQNHNSKILNKKTSHEKSCSCPNTRKDKCPIDNKCLKKAIVYKATVQKSGKFYIGISEPEFKKRHARHIYSFKHQSDKNSTTLSNYLWEIGENISASNPEPAL